MSDTDSAPYSRCWAKAISPCDEGMSREHYMSRGAFIGEYVTIGGLSPVPPELRTMHIDDLVARTLCKKHNEELSHLDQAFIDLVNCIRETERLREIRQTVKSAWYSPVRLMVDAPRIERYILKTAMNYSVVLRGYLDGWVPPDWLPQVVFGVRALEEGRGLGMIARVGDNLVDSESFRFAFGTSERDGIPFSGLLELRLGWRFLCSWARPLSDLAGEFHIDGDVYSPEDIIARPARFQFDHRGRSLGVSLDFDWSGRWTASKFPKVVALRKKYRAPPRKGK